jgi:uncharacterized protein (TIGR02001 family)
MALRLTGWALLFWAALVVPSAAADLVLAKGADAKADDAVKVEFSAGLTSDYIYRGVTLSARKPSANASVEAEWNHFYAAANVQSVKLPTNPAAEVTWTAGYRFTLAKFDFDLNANYFWYPGELLSEGQVATSYWEYDLKVEREIIPDRLTLNASFGYSPNISGTGAWGAYTEAGFEIDLPSRLPQVEWQLIGSAGYWRFGDTAPAQGGFPLPSYTNWHLGVVFTFAKYLNLDLSYWDTNLSKEDCFVFTGDPMATAGGVANPLSNPDGLQSRWCGATFVGTASFKFNLSDVK